jgi:hypothetical protein
VQIGYRHNGPVSGGFGVRCDICGFVWKRYDLRRRADGLLACPDDASETDPVTLSHHQQAATAARRDVNTHWDGAPAITVEEADPI